MNLDPLPAGIASVESVDFYPDAAHTQPATNVAVTTTGTVHTVDTTGVADGRWYPSVNGRDALDAPALYNLPFIDLPDDGLLVLSPEALALQIGMPLPLNDEHRAVFREAILDAQSDVETYLGQPVIPQVFVQQHSWPYLDGWNLTIHDDAEFIEILSTAPEYDVDGVTPTGYFTVTFLAGLDVRNDPTLRPILRYIKAAAASTPGVADIWRNITGTKGAITSLSAEGQGVSFSVAYPAGGAAAGAPGSLTPGSLPTLGSLDRWRVAGRRVFQGATRYGAPDGLW